MTPRGIIRAVCTAPQKGIQKKDIGKGLLIPGKGLEGDGHFGFAHRQVSLLDASEIERMKKIIPSLFYGAFAENLVTEGIDLKALVLGDMLRIGKASQGDPDREGVPLRCAIYEAAGDCIMPRLGIFCEVLTEGPVRWETPWNSFPRNCPNASSSGRSPASPAGRETVTDSMLREARVTLVLDGEEQVTAVYPRRRAVLGGGAPEVPEAHRRP